MMEIMLGGNYKEESILRVLEMRLPTYQASIEIYLMKVHSILKSLR